jgi:hypothetical protein
MPCWTIQTNTLDLKVANKGLLGKALESLGYKPTMLQDGSLVFMHEGRQVKIMDGKIEVPVGKESIVDKIKAAYSTEVLKYASQKFGWSMTKGKKENTYNISRRF